MSFEQKLDQLVSRYENLKEQLANQDGSDPQHFIKLSKEYSDLGPVVEAITTLKALTKEKGDLLGLLKDTSDVEMREMAQLEYDAVLKKIPEQELLLKVLLLPKDADDERNAILEVRAGAGGDEAGLFAAELFRMYQRYASNNKWKFEVINLNESGIGSIKEASATISGKGVFAKLKYESGVHRVQRVPETESGGRVHTSTATVAVLPEVEAVDIEVDEKDLQIDVYRASGAGGQHVNTTDSAVRITHIPTGVVVTQQDERSQHKNKAKAMKILRAKLYEAERMKKQQERAANRKSQVGTGDRSERIRTYNFPQGRVSDHRINLTLYKILPIMEGEALDELIDPLTSEDQAARLAEVIE